MKVVNVTHPSVAQATVPPAPTQTAPSARILYLNALFEGYNAAQIGRVEAALSPIMRMAIWDERLDYLDISRIGSAYRDYIEANLGGEQDE